MCATSTVIDGWRDPTWPIIPAPPTWPSEPHTQPVVPGPNAIQWGQIQNDPTLAKQMLDVLAKLEAIDKRLGMLEHCAVSQAEKKKLKARLRRIAMKKS